MKKIRILFLFTLFFSGTVTWAQEGAGSSGGGNGGGEDVGFATAYGAVCDWVIAKHFDHTLGNKLHLNDLGIDELQFFTKFSPLCPVSTIQVKFVSEKILINNYERVCKVDSAEKAIVCNGDAWGKQEAGLKYLIAFHELLHFIGLEKNLLEYSRYPISSRLLEFVTPAEGVYFELGTNPFKNRLHAVVPNGKGGFMAPAVDTIEITVKVLETITLP